MRPFPRTKEPPLMERPDTCDDLTYITKVGVRQLETAEQARCIFPRLESAIKPVAW